MSVRNLRNKVATANLSIGQPLPEQAPNYGQGRGGRPWRRKRDAVMKRDKYQCQPCKAKGRVTLATQVDHVTPRAEGGTEDDHNLQAICGPCHEAKSAQEAARGAGRQWGEGQTLKARADGHRPRCRL